MGPTNTSRAGPSGSLAETSQQRPRRFRTSKPKVKTGCNNCKQRRIKCGEQRPACDQCVRSKKICTGYPPPPRAKAFEEVPIAPKPRGEHLAPISPANEAVQPVRHQPLSRPTVVRQEIQKRPVIRGLTPPQTPIDSTLMIHRPSMLPFDPVEGQYFQLFRERTASELSGFFDSSFWTRSVLQECHSEEAIRHSVVALGALYKTLEKISESPPSSPAAVDQADNVARHWAVAFKHYSLALNSMVTSTSQDQVSQRMSLMATVLLACFDSFIGDHKQAIVQIQAGLRLLETLREQRRRAFHPKPEEPVEQDLVQMFTRLAIQAKSYDMAFHFPQPFVIRLTPQSSDHPASPSSSDGGSPVSRNQSPIPDMFQSLIEARLAWDNLCETMMRFTENMFTFTTAMSPMGVLPNSLKQYGTSFGEKLGAWSRAFEPILSSRMMPAKSSQEKTAIAVLKMNQIMGEILFYMTFSDTELQFDVYLPRFKNIVDLAMEVVGDEERRAAAKRCPNPDFCYHQPIHPDAFGGQYTARHIKPSFSADLGIVPPLFVVATKCRDSMIRRQAIQLLTTSSRREGMWDSELAARIGSWVMSIEEDDDGADDFGRPTSSSTDMSRLSAGSPGSRSAGSPNFGNDVPLGPGGNARWGSRRESVTLSPYNNRRTIPEERRVMVRAVEFDLRERVATLECGTRGLIPGMRDPRTRATRIEW